MNTLFYLWVEIFDGSNMNVHKYYIKALEVASALGDEGVTKKKIYFWTVALLFDILRSINNLEGRRMVVNEFQPI